VSIARVILVTGLPAAGKTTLARELAIRYRLPLVTKDLVKEPLLDVIGASDAAESRRLSDASFAVLFRMARELVSSGVSVLFEGNFRPGEHETPLREALASSSMQLAQILCRVPEPERIARLQARMNDSSRHAGHRFGERLSMESATCDGFLDVPSLRIVHDGTNAHAVCATLDHWMNLRAT
jgi:predicted kinase